MIGLIVLAIVAFVVLGLVFKLVKVALIVALLLAGVAAVRGVLAKKRLK